WNDSIAPAAPPPSGAAKASHPTTRTNHHPSEPKGRQPQCRGWNRKDRLGSRLMTKTVTLIRSSALSDVAEYAYAATAPADARLIFLAGSCPLNADGTTAAVG